MIIIKSGRNVSICVKDADFWKGNKRYYAMFGNSYYDPENGFRPCMGGPDDVRRRLYDGYVTEYNEVLDGADEAFDGLKKAHDAAIPASVPATPAAVPPVQPSGSGLGNQLEQIMLKVLAEQSVDKVLDIAKPILEKHIVETFGVLPQIHEVVTPEGKREVKGITHEQFDTVLNLVHADIPVFLTGPAGTGKNVICKQVAKALGLEFYFSNAVTQEYKITGFIDANGHYNGTQFYDAFTKGGLFMLDEMDASVPEVLVMLNAAIANRYFDFPTGRVEAHPDFRLIAAGNTFGTGADIEYTGRYQLDAASLDRFAMVTIDYSPAIENAIAQGDTDLVGYIHAFRSACGEAGIKQLATYRAIERIKSLGDSMPLEQVLQICLIKGMPKDDLRVVLDSMDLGIRNKYFAATKALIA